MPVRPGTCSYNFISGTTVNLTTSASNGSQFSGWSGACTGTGPCSVLMTSPQSATATFNISPYVKILGLSQFYGLLQPAYDAASDGAVIEAQGVTIVQNLTMDKSKDVTIMGGYTDQSFTTRSGIIILQGVLTIELGSLTADQLAVK